MHEEVQTHSFLPVPLKDPEPQPALVVYRRCARVWEQMIRGEEYDNMVDVYSFGVVLWEILSLKFPWDELSCMQVAFKVAQRVGTPRAHQAAAQPAVPCPAVQAGHLSLDRRTVLLKWRYCSAQEQVLKWQCSSKNATSGMPLLYGSIWAMQ